MASGTELTVDRPPTSDGQTITVAVFDGDGPAWQTGRYLVLQKKDVLDIKVGQVLAFGNVTNDNILQGTAFG